MFNPKALATQSRRRWPALLGGVLIGAAIGYLIFFGLPERPVTEPLPQGVSAPAIALPGFESGSEAPGFDLMSAGGSPVSLEDHRGAVVLLNFWATWCAPCRTEMPLLQSAYETYEGQGFVVLGIDFDEPATAVMDYGQELGLTFPLLLDPGGEIQQLYKVRGYPTTVVLDREGRIQAYHIGVLAQSQLDGYLEAAGLNP